MNLWYGRCSFGYTRFHIISFEVVLPFVAGHYSELNGMCRAMMITGKTCKARVVVLPLRHVVIVGHYVIYRAYCGTSFAANAFIGNNTEVFIGNEVFCEKPSE